MLKEEQLVVFDEIYLTSGFEHPAMPVITNLEPNEIQQFNWGLIPNWTKTPQDAENIRRYTLNAKAETIFEKPSYKKSIETKRCLVLCSGFFEWKTVKGKKYPHYISLKDDGIFVFGGIWDSWEDAETGEEINTYSIITVEANELCAEIHNIKKRMPLILKQENALHWLSSSLSKNEIQALLVPFDSSLMKAHTVKKILPNKTSRQNSSEVIAYYNYPELNGLIRNEDYEQGSLF